MGGRLGYVIFYDMNYYLKNPFDIVKIWQGGMSFHGAMLGIIIGTFIFSKKNNIKTFFLLDIIACVSPIGIFLGRIANFINSELVGKASDVYWAVIFPKIDNVARHPSQLYEAFFEGLVLFLFLNFAISKKNKTGRHSAYFLIGYGISRSIVEFYKSPDSVWGNDFLLFSFLTQGQLLSIPMIILGLFILSKK